MHRRVVMDAHREAMVEGRARRVQPGRAFGPVDLLEMEVAEVEVVGDLEGDARLERAESGELRLAGLLHVDQLGAPVASGNGAARRIERSNRLVDGGVAEAFPR